MGNTGKKIVLTLKQVNSVTFAPTGLTEPNTFGTPEYIPPTTDTIDCPISNSLSCPVTIASGFTGSLGFEFSLFTSTVTNPQVSSVKVIAISQSLPIASSSFALPHATPHYYSGSISVPHGIYTLNVQFISGSSVLSTCTNNTGSISVS